MLEPNPSCAVETTYDNAINAASPVINWPMAETSGSTASDTSGNSYNGTYSTSGVTPMAANYGPYYGDGGGQTFDGSTGVATAPSGFTSAYPSGAFTISEWVDPGTTDTGMYTYQSVFGNEDVDGSGNWYGVGMWGANAYGYLYLEPLIGLTSSNYGTLDYIYSGAAIPDGQWSLVQLVWVYDTTNSVWDLNLYIDGSWAGDTETNGAG
ncbi:MAG TPA: hypothetical protein VNU75_03660, partial [Acidimicrobiales bacterium]|nr:hypothetical protein [Acidimicrobiales bacterium]